MINLLKSILKKIGKFVKSNVKTVAVGVVASGVAVVASTSMALAQTAPVWSDVTVDTTTIFKVAGIVLAAVGMVWGIKIVIGMFRGR